ncbi:hypothetical protein Ocin01_13292 [Orchesella cincta]|uniref:Uncharacterized protein n=1 Tax=Orchesella cincta TaxID=48709 RepID=A0A1D2MKL3_ORCCI|nr:hypothetical protein Ocin01_13292 [Orchesella cincta]
MILNFGYAGSTPGVLKIVTVVIACFSQGFIALGYYNAAYIHTTINGKTREEVCNHNKKLRIEHYCPIGSVVLWSMIISMISFWASLIMLIAHLIFQLNKTFFKVIDWIGHFVGGLAMLVAGAISIFYSIPAYWAKTCRVCDIDIMCIEPDPDCMKNRKAIYQPLLMLLGGIFATCSGFVYIGTGIAIMKQSSDKLADYSGGHGHSNLE